MDIITLVTNSLVVVAVGLVLGYMSRERFEAVDRQIGDLRAEMRQELGNIRNEMATMRSDLTHVALAMGSRDKPNSA